MLTAFDDRKIKCGKIFLDGIAGPVVPIKEAVSILTEETFWMGDTQRITIEIVYRSQHELDVLPEFEGW